MSIFEDRVARSLSAIRRRGLDIRLAAQLGPTPVALKRLARHPVSRQDSLVVRGERRVWLRTFAPRRPLGALFVAPGLHYLGPDDPRLNDFLFQLAGAGLLVGAPFLPDYCNLIPTPAVHHDFAVSFDAFRRAAADKGLIRPGLFSISFGSLPALWLAASEAFARTISGVITFGGYADWQAALRFTLTGIVEQGGAVPHDPLNRPVVFMNVLAGIPDKWAPIDARAELVEAWRRFVTRTWGRPDMKQFARYGPLARAMSDRLPASIRQLFLMGCGVVDGGNALALAALENLGTRDFLDPRPRILRGLRAPLHVIHGVNDDVIPVSEMDQLAISAGSRVTVRTYRTGLFEHTAASGRSGLKMLSKELGTLLRMLEAIGQTATDDPSGRGDDPHGAI